MLYDNMTSLLLSVITATTDCRRQGRQMPMRCIKPAAMTSHPMTSS